MPFHGEGWPAARCTVGRGGGGGETLQELVWGVAEEEAGPVRSRFGSEEDGRLAARSSISAIHGVHLNAPISPSTRSAPGSPWFSRSSSRGGSCEATCVINWLVVMSVRQISPAAILMESGVMAAAISLSGSKAGWSGGPWQCTTGAAEAHGKARWGGARREEEQGAGGVPRRMGREVGEERRKREEAEEERRRVGPTSVLTGGPHIAT